MRHNRAKLKLVVPEWVKERSRGIEYFNENSPAYYASYEEHFRVQAETQQGIDQLQESMGADYQKPDLGKPGVERGNGIAYPALSSSDDLQPIPNVPKGFKPDFEARPYSPQIDGTPTFDLQPGKPKTSREIPPEDIGKNEPPQEPDYEALKDYINNVIRGGGISFAQIGNQFGSTLPNLPEGLDSIIDSVRKELENDSKSQGPGTSRPPAIRVPDRSEPGKKRPKRNPKRRVGPDNGSGPNRNPHSPKEQDPASKRGWQEILPTVKSGCEAMIKLAEIGGEIQKQLAQVLDRNSDRGGLIPLLADQQPHAKQFGHGMQSNREDQFKRDYENFIARSTARDRAARRPVRRRI